MRVLTRKRIFAWVAFIAAVIGMIAGARIMAPRWPGAAGKTGGDAIGDAVVDRTGMVQEESKAPGEPEAIMAMAAGPRDFFAESRLERDRARSRRMELLQDMLESSPEGSQERAAIQRELLRMSAAMENEERIEALIRARGYVDAVVFVSDNSCDIIVETSSGLTQVDARQIGDMAARTTGLAPQTITITERRPGQG
ncbi:MAG: SpoIIIAH-like family protein [Firmicutes bacterium]|nr:SpoIIIAH-like family protein [Bacillota bacterium]